MTTASSYDSRLTNERPNVEDSLMTIPSNLKESSMPTDLPKQEHQMLTDSTNQELPMSNDLTETPNSSNDDLGSPIETITEEAPPPRIEVARPIAEADREKSFLEDRCKNGRAKATPPVKPQVKTYTEMSDDEAVEELNKKHGAIHTGRFAILTEKLNPSGTMDFTLETKQSFLDTYENQVVRTTKKGRPITKAAIWIKSPNRRTYDGFTFNPSLKPTPWKKGDKASFYNLWKGFTVEPKEGKCSSFKVFVKEIICKNNDIYFPYVWKWLAHLIQHPDELSTGLVLMSNQGTGKNTFVDAIGRLFGSHYLLLASINQLVGNFNAHQKYAVLINANEALWGGNRKEIGAVKAMVTEKLCMIEEKGKDLIVLPNFKHLILMSNEDWPVHLDKDDRRFLVLQVSEDHKEDLPYFKAIHDELNNGGYEALLYELQHVNLEGFTTWTLPQNDEAFEVKLQSAASTEKYIYEVLQVGSFDIGNGTPTTGWPTKTTPKQTNSVYADYTSWCEKNNIRKESKEALGKTIQKLICSTIKERPRENGNRIQIYRFPDLKQARLEFGKAFKISEKVWE